MGLFCKGNCTCQPCKMSTEFMFLSHLDIQNTLQTDKIQNQLGECVCASRSRGVKIGKGK